MNAIKLLTQDHRAVEELFGKFENARGAATKQKLVHRICAELKIHTSIEEEIFYPALKGKIDDALLEEAIVEHDGAKILVNDLEAAAPDEDYYDAKVKVLSEEIEHHVKEEEKERDSMFARARKTDVDLDALGERMAARKAELVAENEASGLPDAALTAIDER
jgi:hypothetical protein